MKGRFVVILVAVTAVAIAAVVALGGKDSSSGGGGSGGGGAKPAKDAISVCFAYSPEKEKLLAPLIERFNAQRTRGRRSAGLRRRPRSVSLRRRRARGSPRGRLKPVAWSPASSLWGRLLNFEADQRLRARRQPVDRAHPARDRHVGAARACARLAAQAGRLRRRSSRWPPAKRGWAAYGKPEFGALQARPHQPRLLDLRSVRGRRRVLRGDRQEGGADRADVARPAVRAQIQAHRALDRPLRRHDAVLRRPAEASYGPAYASAVAMEEVTLSTSTAAAAGTKLVGDLSRRRARSSPTTPTSCSTRRG